MDEAVPPAAEDLHQPVPLFDDLPDEAQTPALLSPGSENYTVSGHVLRRLGYSASTTRRLTMPSWELPGKVAQTLTS
jgi:hypothetical protein